MVNMIPGGGQPLETDDDFLVWVEREFEDLYPTGVGKLIRPRGDGRWYMIDFQEGTYGLKVGYHGYITIEGTKHGEGLLVTDEEKYEGFFDNDVKSGRGLMKYRGGGFYKGSWLNDKKNGFGVQRFPCGDIYKGLWRDDVMDGQGEYTYASGTVFSGIFINGKVYHGESRNGSDAVFRGEYRDGKPWSGVCEKMVVNWL